MIYGDAMTLWEPTYGTDVYGNPKIIWNESGKTEFDGVSVQPIVSSEAVGDRPFVVNGYRVFSHRGMKIPAEAADRIIIDGVTFEMDGDPAHFTMGGRHHHTELRVTRVAG